MCTWWLKLLKCQQIVMFNWQKLLTINVIYNTKGLQKITMVPVNVTNVLVKITKNKKITSFVAILGVTAFAKITKPV